MIEVLVGPIASGKSTYARKRAEMGAVIVNNDAIVTAVHGGIYTAYNKALKPFYKAVETFMITTALAMGRDVVIDRTNMNRGTRLRYTSLAKAFGTKAYAVLFQDEGPEVHARRRTDSDSRGWGYEYWLEAAQAHQKNASHPSKDEGFDIVLPSDLMLAALIHQQQETENAIPQA